jgi:peptidyl-prolyl cis-trans isomerase C
MTTIDLPENFSGDLLGHRAPSRWTELKRKLRAAMREPLLHFLALGAAIFAVAQYDGAASHRNDVVVDSARVAQIVQTYRQLYGFAPSPVTLRSLISSYIDEEIFYREGTALGLDKDDEVVRRRVVQKMQFVADNLRAPAAPPDSELRGFYNSHQAQFSTPATVSFSHIFFSTAKDGEAGALARAQAVLAKLNDGHARAPQLGDAFFELYDYSGLQPEQAARLFGKTPIVPALFRAPVGHWSGPYRSGYGWHLIYASSANKAHTASFADAHEAVRIAYLQSLQAKANAATKDALRAKYRVIREDRGERP